MSENSVLDPVMARFSEARWEISESQWLVDVDRPQLADLAAACKEAGFEVCVDITAVDWYRLRRTRFQVVVEPAISSTPAEVADHHRCAPQ